MSSSWLLRLSLTNLFQVWFCFFQLPKHASLCVWCHFYIQTVPVPRCVFFDALCWSLALLQLQSYCLVLFQCLGSFWWLGDLAAAPMCKYFLMSFPVPKPESSEPADRCSVSAVTCAAVPLVWIYLRLSFFFKVISGGELVQQLRVIGILLGGLKLDSQHLCPIAHICL